MYFKTQILNSEFFTTPSGLQNKPLYDCILIFIILNDHKYDYWKEKEKSMNMGKIWLAVEQAIFRH